MIHVLTHYTNNWKCIANISIPIMEEYCDKHGYCLHVKKVPDYKKYDGLHKLKMLDGLDNNDFGLLLDVDTLITNLTIPIEDFIHFGSNTEIYLSEGANCGVMLMKKVHRGTVDVIMEGILHGQFNCEQDGIECLLKKEDEFDIKLLPHPAFNSFLPHLYSEIKEEKTEKEGKWTKGHFCLHVPGLDLKKREEILKEYSQYIVYE